MKRDVYKEYKQGLISWDEAYRIANNIAATASDNLGTSYEETDYWCKQMESLAIDMAEMHMKEIGYTQREDGVFSKPDINHC